MGLIDRESCEKLAGANSSHWTQSVKFPFAGLPRSEVAGSALRTYPNLKHEILNEPIRATIYQDILDWIEAREAERG